MNLVGDIVSRTGSYLRAYAGLLGQFQSNEGSRCNIRLALHGM